MSRIVRNFWISTDADGVQKTQATGPKGADGGFDTTVYMRTDGEVQEAVEILGRAHGDRLVLTIRVATGEEITLESDR